MRNFEDTNMTPETISDDIAQIELLVHPEQIALRGAGKLTEVLGVDRANQLIVETKANQSKNYRWALRNFGGIARA